MIIETSTKRFEKEVVLMYKRGKDIKKLIKCKTLYNLILSDQIKRF
jgi:hypothetical protein